MIRYDGNLAAQGAFASLKQCGSLSGFALAGYRGFHLPVEPNALDLQIFDVGTHRLEGSQHLHVDKGERLIIVHVTPQP